MLHERVSPLISYSAPHALERYHIIHYVVTPTYKHSASKISLTKPTASGIHAILSLSMYITYCTNLKRDWLFTKSWGRRKCKYFSIQAGHYSKLFGSYCTSDHESIQKVPKLGKLQNLDWMFPSILNKKDSICMGKIRCFQGLNWSSCFWFTQPTLSWRFYTGMATVTAVRTTGDDVCQPALALSTHPAHDIKSTF